MPADVSGRADRTEKICWRKLIAGVILLILLALSADRRLSVDRFSLEDSRFGESVRIVFLSDLHGSRYGDLSEIILQEQPDLILLGGDMLDEKRSDEEFVKLLKALKNIPVYGVLGNHEYRRESLEQTRKLYASLGVTLLEGETQELKLQGQKLSLSGISDPEGGDFFAGLERVSKPSEDYRILLSHRPEYQKLYAEKPFDLVLAGHAHGGQWMIPGFNIGILAPGQGLFPGLVNGLYESDAQKLLVSRGLMKNFVPRFFNRPMIAVMELGASE